MSPLASLALATGLSTDDDEDREDEELFLASSRSFSLRACSFSFCLASDEELEEDPELPLPLLPLELDAARAPDELYELEEALIVGAGAGCLLSSCPSIWSENKSKSRNPKVRFTGEGQHLQHEVIVGTTSRAELT